MSTLTNQLPESPKKTIEALAAKECYSARPFLASARADEIVVEILRTNGFDSGFGKPLAC